jgi:hypothetical protein
VSPLRDEDADSHAIRTNLNLTGQVAFDWPHSVLAYEEHIAELS